MPIYLESFKLPCWSLEYPPLVFDDNGKFIGNNYPSNFFPGKMLNEINLKPVTIFYGGNGSGKTTLLNLIANNLKLIRISPYNLSD